jgi:membrane-associated phospholipid phosphatase
MSGPAGVLALYSAGLALHTFLRGEADDLGGRAVSAGGADRLLFHGVPPVWLQRWTPDLAAIRWLAVGLHASYFVVPLLLMFLVYKRMGARAAFEVVLLQLLMFYAADLIYAICPTRPPWMDYDVTRFIANAYGHGAALDDNTVASAPSLHVALPVLFAFWSARQQDGALRRLSLPLVLWALAVAWAVVYGGEHFVTGAIAGALLAVTVYGAFSIARSRILERAVRQAPATAPLLVPPGHLPPSIGRVIEAEK